MASLLKLLQAFSLVAASATALSAQQVPITSPASSPPLSVQKVDDPAKQIAQLQSKLDDWAALHRYAQANAELPPAGEDRVVFYGDSITDA